MAQTRPRPSGEGELDFKEGGGGSAMADPKPASVRRRGIRQRVPASMPSSRQPIPALIFLLVLSACSSPTEEAALPLSPTTTPVYELSLPVEAELVPLATDSGEWLVLGIAGEAAQAIADPHVLIVLRDRAGAEITRRTIEIPAGPLPSASAWPFREPFPPATP